jgi:hypothetical protein
MVPEPVPAVGQEPRTSIVNSVLPSMVTMSFGMGQEARPAVLLNEGPRAPWPLNVAVPPVVLPTVPRVVCVNSNGVRPGTTRNWRPRHAHRMRGSTWAQDRARSRGTRLE